MRINQIAALLPRIALVPSEQQQKRASAVSFTATQLAKLTDGDVGKSIIRVHNSRIDRKTDGAVGYRRREAVVLRNKDKPENWTLGVVMGAGRSVEGLSQSGIAIDYDMKEQLALSGGVEAFEVSVSPATHQEIFRWYWDHPDPGMMLATRLGALGAALGLFGVLLGFIGLAMAL